MHEYSLVRALADRVEEEARSRQHEARHHPDPHDLHEQPEADLALYAFPKGTWKHEKIIYSVLYGAYAAGAAPMIDLEAMIDLLQNAPSIVMWVPFNEGWGQYDTERLTRWTKDYDPTRLVTNASGWTDFAGAA